MKAIEWWRVFWRFSGFERGVALEAAVLLPANRLGLRLAGFRRWKAALDTLARPVRPAAVSEEERLETAQEIARVERSVARHLFFRPNCLEQSLALLWLLKARGIAAELRIGAQKEDGRFGAHAWVERNGVVLNEAGESQSHFVPFDGPLALRQSGLGKVSEPTPARQD